jgi:hypothetical protein
LLDLPAIPGTIEHYLTLDLQKTGEVSVLNISDIISLAELEIPEEELVKLAQWLGVCKVDEHIQFSDFLHYLIKDSLKFSDWTIKGAWNFFVKGSKE